ncbi:MAG: hypothetical protein KBT20_04075 [Bacteroidales bacterium]|nr:hypothetical protein [Candidatus Liminaster caballi]
MCAVSSRLCHPCPATHASGGTVGDNNSGNGQVSDELDNGTTIPGSGGSIKV